VREFADVPCGVGVKGLRSRRIEGFEKHVEEGVGWQQEEGVGEWVNMRYRVNRIRRYRPSSLIRQTLTFPRFAVVSQQDTNALSSFLRGSICLAVYRSRIGSARRHAGAAGIGRVAHMQDLRLISKNEEEAVVTR